MGQSGCSVVASRSAFLPGTLRYDDFDADASINLDQRRETPMEYTERTPEERQELLAQWRRAYEAFRAGLSDLTDEELDEIARQVTEEVDEKIRQEAIRLQRRAS
ncbi:MAG: hypothetical protein ACKOWF_04945 [Chloroflexota bacterium]